MRVFSSWQFASSASLLTTAVLLCLVPFLLSWPASGSEQGTNGHPIDDGPYPAMLAEEDKVRDELPKDAIELSLPSWGSSGCRALLSSALPIFLSVSCLCAWERCRP